MQKSKYTEDEVHELLNKNGYIWFDGKYENCKSQLYCYNSEGYKVVLSLDKLENRGDNFNPFYKNGPFYIENLNTYIGKHDVDYKLQTTQKEFNGNDLILRCKLGHMFYKTFKNIRNLPQKCPICRKYNVKIKPPSRVKKDTYTEIIREAEKRNLKVLTTKEEFIKDKTYIHLYDGMYYYKSNVTSFLYGKTSLPFTPNNPYTIKNINTYLNNKKDCSIKCLSDTYVNRNHELDFECLNCGLEFKMTWQNAYRHDGTHNGIRCPSCGLHTESLHASVLKQVFLHEYPDTVVEEKSCISTITGNILPTDIVNHSLKIAIEIQSQYHDREYQKQKDEIKKSYWLSQNYHFYSPDIRDYTVLEMIQLFFPNIAEIPAYIDYSYGGVLNYKYIQEKMNSGITVADISKELGISYHLIFDAIYHKKLVYPKNYIRGDYTPVVQLDVNGNFIASYNTIKEAAKNVDNKPANIASCLYHNSHYSKGFFWFYKYEYDSGNYIVPKLNPRNKEYYNIPVEQYDLQNTYIKTFSSINDASKESGLHCCVIFDVMNGKRKSRGGYIWKYAA